MLKMLWEVLSIEGYQELFLGDWNGLGDLFQLPPVTCLTYEHVGSKYNLLYGDRS